MCSCCERSDKKKCVADVHKTCVIAISVRCEKARECTKILGPMRMGRARNNNNLNHSGRVLSQSWALLVRTRALFISRNLRMGPTQFACYSRGTKYDKSWDKLNFPSSGRVLSSSKCRCHWFKLLLILGIAGEQPESRSIHLRL